MNCNDCSYTKFDGVYPLNEDLTDEIDTEDVRQIIGQEDGLAVIANRTGPSLLVDLYNDQTEIISHPEDVMGCQVMDYIMDHLKNYQERQEGNSEGINTYLLTNLGLGCCLNNSEKYGNLVSLEERM